MSENGAVYTRDDCVNIAEGLARVRDNQKLYTKMLGMFMESGEFAALEEYLTQKDYAKAADSAHAIKGMTGNLSLTALFNTSTRLMEELRQGAASEEAETDFRAAYSQTRVYVQEVIGEMEA